MWKAFICWFLSQLGVDIRGIFRFWDGARWRAVDPFEAARRLFTDKEFDWEETPQLLDAPGVRHQLKATATIVAAVRSAFSVAELSQGGLTELECLELLWRFRAYLGDVKKNGSLLPISQPSTEPKPPPAAGLTRCDSESGSTPTGNFLDEHGESARESPVPAGEPA